MSNMEQKTFQQAINHANRSRQEVQAMCKSLFPQAFWDHAHEAKTEAKLAAKAFRRAVRQQVCKKHNRRTPAIQKIEIA